MMHALSLFVSVQNQVNQCTILCFGRRTRNYQFATHADGLIGFREDRSFPTLSLLPLNLHSILALNQTSPTSITDPFPTVHDS